MISKNAIDEWRKTVFWDLDEPVAQDLLLSKVMVDLYSDLFIQEHLVLKGSAALQKLYFDRPYRYSKDLNFVQISPGPFDIIVNHIKSKMDWLGRPTLKIGEGRITLYYKIFSEMATNNQCRIKLEIHTFKHDPILRVISKKYAIENPWATGSATVTTYCLEELLAIQTLALYQRKKGRYLFDLYYALRQLNPNPEQIARFFCFYLEKSGRLVTRAGFEENLFNKITHQTFLNDIDAVIPNEFMTGFEAVEAMQYVHKNLITLLPGEPWFGDLAGRLGNLI
jgi:predicted nucleotidyltransferase component of viral defense system